LCCLGRRTLCRWSLGCWSWSRWSWSCRCLSCNLVLVLATQSKVEAEESTGGADGLRIEPFLLQLLSVVSVPLWQEPGLSTRSAAASLPVLRLQSEPACTGWQKYTDNCQLSFEAWCTGPPPSEFPNFLGCSRPRPGSPPGTSALSPRSAVCSGDLEPPPLETVGHLRTV